MARQSAGQDQALIAAMSVSTPMMFMSRFML
jgi:hypothetical protein